MLVGVLTVSSDRGTCSYVGISYAELLTCIVHGNCRFLPYVGMVTIIMNDYPMLKYGLIAVLAILVITSKE